MVADPRGVQAPESHLVANIVWKIETRGYGGYSALELRGEYELIPAAQTAKTPAGRNYEEKHGRTVLYLLKLRDGGLVRGEGKFGDEIATYRPSPQGVFPGASKDTDPQEGVVVEWPGAAGASGVLTRRLDGKLEMHVVGPAVEMVNGAAEEAAGCWATWPTLEIPPGDFSSSRGTPRTFSEKVKMPEAPDCSGTMRVDIAIMLDVEAVMTVKKRPDAPAWLPRGSILGETDPGSDVSIEVRLQPKDRPGSPSPERAKFRFELSDVSSEPGVAMNWPPKEKVKGTPDLAIEDVRNPDFDVKTSWTTEGGRAGASASTKEKTTTAQVVVSSFDFGGHGTLKVWADLEGGGTVRAHLEGQSRVEELKLPEDEDGNFVADFWERTRGIRGLADEDDTPRGDPTCNAGDGFSLYEEYRGFFTRGAHVRTEPSQKDLFVFVAPELPVEAFYGVGVFADKTGIATHVVRLNEMGEDRVMNFNSGSGHLIDQHGLRVGASQLSGGFAGKAKLGPPAFVPWVNLRDDLGLGTESTTVHELGHAVSIPHHGDGDYPALFKKGELPGLEEDKTLWVAVQGGEHSGEEECFMSYRNAKVVKTAAGKYELYPARPTRRTLFCTTKGSNPVAGAATNGNCMAKICVSDRGYR